MRRTIGFKAGGFKAGGFAVSAVCAVALGVMAAGITPTRMVGVALDEPESPAWQSPEPTFSEPADDYSNGGYDSAWSLSGAGMAPSHFQEPDRYYAADDTTFSDSEYVPEQYAPTDDSYAAPMNEEIVEIAAASAEHAAQDVQDALAAPMIADGSAREQTSAIPVADLTPTSTPQQLAAVQR